MLLLVKKSKVGKLERSGFLAVVLSSAMCPEHTWEELALG